jgi:hypothetical protein
MVGTSAMHHDGSEFDLDKKKHIIYNENDDDGL